VLIRCSLLSVVILMMFTLPASIAYAQTNITKNLSELKQSWYERGIVDVELPALNAAEKERLLVDLAQLGATAYIKGTDPVGFAFAYQALYQMLDGLPLDAALVAALDSPDTKVRARAADALRVFFERTRMICAPNNPLPEGCSSVGIFYNGNRTAYLINQVQHQLEQRSNWSTMEFLRLSRNIRPLLEETSIDTDELASTLARRLLVELDPETKHGLVDALGSYLASSGNAGVEKLAAVLRNNLTGANSSLAESFVLAVAEINPEETAKAQGWIALFNVLESKDSVPALGVLLSHPDFNVAWRSAETAAWFTGKDELVPVWVANMSDESAAVRWAGVRAFTAIGLGLQPAVALQVGDANQHRDSIRAALIALLDDDAPSVRWAALEALELWLDKDAVHGYDSLMAILQDAEAPEDARARAARLLIQVAPTAEKLQPEVAQLAQLHNKVAIYKSKTEGYNTFRIPAIVQTTKGTLLAFAEGRRNSASDTGDIDVVLKRSTDQGQTWSSLQVIWSDGTNTSGNPTPVVDEETGRIWLFMAHNHGLDTEAAINAGTSIGIRTLWLTYSDDDGLTWAAPRNMFSEVQDPNTKGDTVGPGIGIQLRHGPHKGRLVVPALGRVIYSDDHGNTWKQGGRVGAGNESQVVELSDGRLMRNDRPASWSPTNAVRSRRVLVISEDQGQSWGPVRYAPELTTPYVQGSIVRYKAADSPVPESRYLLFSNPALETQRYDMTVWLSQDDGETWPIKKSIHPGPAGYSCLIPLADGNIGLLFEGGKDWAYENIYWTRFSLDWLMDQ